MILSFTFNTALKSLIIIMNTFKTGKAAIEALVKHSIIPDVVKSNFVRPLGVLTANYSNGKSVVMGNNLGINETQLKPKVHFAAQNFTLNASDLLTLVVTDPDAPSRNDKKWSEFCHYVESDIKVPDSEGGVLENGQVLKPYVSPAPPAGSGSHRYVFLLFKQPTGVSASQLTSIKDRPNWGYGTPATGIDKWSSENRLSLLAANFFYAEKK